MNGGSPIARRLIWRVKTRPLFYDSIVVLGDDRDGDRAHIGGLWRQPNLAFSYR